MQQSSQEPISSLIYRLETMERDIAQLKSQLNLYVPARENDLRLQSVSDTVTRIESELSKVKERLEMMNTHMVTQESDAQKRDAQQRESQDKLQIRVLWGILSIFISIITLTIVAYLTHLIH